MAAFMRMAVGALGLSALALAAAQPGSGAYDQAAAAPTSQPESYYLRVTVDRLNLRSRPDQNSVAVAQVERDAVLRGSGFEFGWHRVVPPDGVFSYVSAQYIRPTGPDEGVVAVESGKLRVRVGSRLTDLDPLRSEVQTLLAPGARVQIVGRQGDWYKIVPPEGVCLFASDEHVERVSADVASRLRTAAGTTQPAEAVAAGGPQSRPAAAPDLSGPWGQRLRLAEAAIEAEAAKPLSEQVWSGPIALLQPIADQRVEPVVARLAQEWIWQLEQRVADQAVLREAEQIERQQQRGRTRFERELERLRQAASDAAAGRQHTARGQVLLSLALRGENQGMRYKLEDPLSGRLVAYLEPAPDADVRIDAFAGQYVGVLGERRFDEGLGAQVIRVRQVDVLKRPTAATRPARQQP